MGITAFVSIASALLQLTHLVCVCTVTMRRDSLLQLDGGDDDGNDDWDRQTSLDQWMSKVVGVNTNHNNKSKQTPDATNTHNNNTQHRRENLASTRFLEEFVIQQCHHVSGDIDVEGGAQDGTNKHMFALPMAMLASTLSSQLTEETDKHAFLQFAKYVCSDHHATTNDVDIAHIVLPTHTNTHTSTTHTTSTHPSKHTNTSISVVLRVISHCFGRLLAGCVQRDPTLGNAQSSSHMRITSVLFAHIERVLAAVHTHSGDHCPLVLQGLLMCVLASHGCRQFGFHRVDPAIVNAHPTNPHTINTQVLAAAFQRNCFEQNKLLKCVLESIHTRNHQAMPQAIPNSTAHTTPTHMLAESLLVWLICGCTMTGTLTHTLTHTLTYPHTQSSITMLSCLVSCISSENIRNRSKLSEWKAAHTHPYAHTTHTGAVCVPTVIRSLLLTTLSYCVTVLNHLRTHIGRYFMCPDTEIQCTDDEMMVTLDAFRTVWFECLSTIFMCLDKIFVRQAHPQQQTAKKQTTRSSSSKQSLMAAAGLETLTWMTHTCLRTLIHAVSTHTTTSKPNMLADKLKALSADIMMHLLQTQQQPTQSQHQQQAQMFHVCVFPALRETLACVCAQTLKDWHTHTHISSAFPTNTHTNTRQPQAPSLDAHVLQTVDRFQAAVDDEDDFFDDDDADEGAMSAHSHQHNHHELMHLIVCVLANINTAANMLVTEFLGASTQTPHNRSTPNMGPLASMHVHAFKESMATLDCVHKEMNVYANTHTNAQSSSSSQQQTDNPLQTWLQCKFLASLLSSVSAGVWTVCVKDVIVPNMYRVQSVWLACVIALTIPHATHSPQSHTRSNAVSGNNASIVASIEFVAFHVGLLRVWDAVCSNPSQFTSTMNTSASTLAALAAVFTRSQAAHTTTTASSQSQQSQQSLQSQLTNISQSNSQSQLQSQTPSQQGVAGTQLSVLSSQATANSASIVASTININMDTSLPLQPPVASGASSGSGSGSGSILANKQLHRSVSAASASSSASSSSSASMREYSPTWCKRALQSYMHTLTIPPINTNTNAAATATNLQTGISLSHLSTADTIHRHIRYVSMCLFNLPSSSASTGNSVHTQLTANRHFMKALLLSVWSHPLVSVCTNTTMEEIKSELNKCLTEYFNASECGRIDDTIARLLVMSVQPQTHTTTAQSSTAANTQQMLVPDHRDSSHALSNWLLMLRAVTSKGLAFASRDQDWLPMLRSLVNNWSLLSFVDVVSPRMDVDSVAGAAVVMNPQGSNAGHKLAMKAMVAWCLSTMPVYDSTVHSSRKQFVSILKGKKGLTESLSLRFDYTKVLGASTMNSILDSCCECLEHDMNTSFAVDNANCANSSIQSCVAAADARLLDFKSYVLLSDTPWQLVCSQSTSSVASTSSSVSGSLLSKKCVHTRACMSVYNSFLSYLLYRSSSHLNTGSGSNKNTTVTVATNVNAMMVSMGEDLLLCASCALFCVQTLRLLLGESAASVDPNCNNSTKSSNTAGGSSASLLMMSVNAEASLILQRLLLVLLGTHTAFFVNYSKIQSQVAHHSSYHQCFRLIATTCKAINLGVVNSDASSSCNDVFVEAVQACRSFLNQIPECLLKLCTPSSNSNGVSLTSAGNTSHRCRRCLCCVGGGVFEECRSQCNSLNDRLALLQGNVVHSFNERQTQVSKFSAGDGKEKPRYSVRHVTRTILKLLTLCGCTV
jgi:hypothetical protein